jgi:peptide subunit release factor 1 (eRF1)
MKIETRIAGHAAEAILSQFDGRYLSLSGPPDLRSALLHELPGAIRDHDGGIFSVDVHANASEVRAAAEPTQRAVEAREEVCTVRRLIDAGPHNAAWDVPATLAALHQHRVRTLIVDDTFSQHGVRCRICGCLSGAHIDRCMSCGGAAIEVIEDVVEFGLEQALQQEAALELVRSEAARRLMTRVGPMGAILRW